MNGDTLAKFGALARTIAGIVPEGEFGDVARFVANALAFGADLANSGVDPAIELKHIHDQHPSIDAAKRRIRERFMRRFGESL